MANWNLFHILFHRLRCWFHFFILNDFFEALLVPIADQSDGRHSQQTIRQQGDLFHDVRQSNGQLFAQKYEGFFLARI